MTTGNTYCCQRMALLLPTVARTSVLSPQVKYFGVVEGGLAALVGLNTSTAVDPLAGAITDIEVMACNPGGTLSFVVPWSTEAPENVPLKTPGWRVSIAPAVTLSGEMGQAPWSLDNLFAAQQAASATSTGL
jgi:hypothetical protein